MTRSEQAMAAAIEAILAAGFVPAGETARDSFRMPTVETPVYGGVGGKVVTIGGRQRFAKPNTSRRATVGKVTTCLYDSVPGEQPYNFAMFSTKDIAAIRAALEG